MVGGHVGGCTCVGWVEGRLWRVERQAGELAAHVQHMQGEVLRLEESQKSLASTVQEVGGRLAQCGSMLWRRGQGFVACALS